ncbi:hypothetical protein QFC21_003848 [Naganishia friedmannii]|uniref:Uncharacterized protein n=1 Tax=Naganishia friedmannii TaxID=89922 RepID=A0ACC2VL57_9TREE|nr:hypothetical protein QFC21_003848 [Naganishia friedmannii]
MQDPENNTTALLALLQHLLPSSTTSTLTQPTDLVAAYVHAVLISLRFRLNTTPNESEERSSESRVHAEEAGNAAAAGADDDDTLSEADTAVADDDQQPAESVPEQGFTRLGVTVADAEASRLPGGWNTRGEDSYTFTYKHQQSQMTFTFKVGRIGNRVSVMGMAEDGEPYQLSVVLSDYVQASFLPWPREDEPAARQRPLKEGFASINKSSRGVNPSTGPPSGGAFPAPRAPQGGPPRLPDEPNYHDPSSRGGFPYNPSIGHRDLDPTAAFQPPGMGRRGFDPSHDGGGMLVDFNHPLFAGRRRADDEQGPGGMQNPPGARWDPVGPGFSTGGRNGGGLGAPTGGMRGSDGLRDPDFDELLPPGEFGPDLRMPGQRGSAGRGRGGFGGGMGNPFDGTGMGAGFGARGAGGGFGGGLGGGGGFFM